ncbi:hypothetical protein PV327_002988 [Microctonus hyperodae]|uniref:F-box domain-containing protein n=1 Tax=Microctonus hyperodae TaxID=165561 RepID=A0AA39L0L0_MICHY|nr:hypothetical protein PV327_002988 [Microctonus hyperodae]
MKGKRSKSLSPEPSSSRDAKFPKLSCNSQINDDIGNIKAHILDFSDDILLNIMRFLTPQDLLALSLCCYRLFHVCRDRTLWRIADFRTKPMRIVELKKYLKYFQPHTTSIAINGNFKKDHENEGSLEELKSDFLLQISKNCRNIKELLVEEYSIVSKDIKITFFPATLEKLSLKGTQVYHLIKNKSYFFEMDRRMPNLTTLIVSDCQWLTGHSLLVISKMPKLKELRLDSCKNLGDCVAYASLATRFGFKTLEILDLRRTGFGDSEIRAFSSTKTLTHLYLENSSKNTESTDRMEYSRDLFPGPTYEDHILAQYALHDNQHMGWNDLSHCRISDTSICSLGSYVCDRRVLNDTAREVILIEEEVRVFNNPNLKILVVRNYPLVTNKSLVHLAANANSLEYLDITGCAVTKNGVETFKSQKPHVMLISSFDET